MITDNDTDLLSFVSNIRLDVALKILSAKGKMLLQQFPYNLHSLICMLSIPRRWVGPQCFAVCMSGGEEPPCLARRQEPWREDLGLYIHGSDLE